MLITYLLIRLLTLPLAYLPYRALHALGRHLGTLAYHLIPKYRKRALSNLALASDLHLSNDDVRRIAKASLQSLMITCLEYPKLAREKDISNIATCVNPEKADAIMAQGKGVIFFCGHQSNWELLFLEGTSRMPGVAIGRPIKNHYLYNWVQSMRQKFGGTIISPRNAIKEGLRGLKNGAFLGIVGDQGMPDSGYSSMFLGREAWTSPIPALLSYKTRTPLIVATTHRKGGHYYIHYSDPLYPNKDTPKELEVKRLMDAALSLYQESIKKHPEEWLWIHNRWKQQTTDIIKRPYRQDSIALFLPDDPALAAKLPHIRTLYPREHLSIYIPQSLQVTLDAEIHPYTHLSETLEEDLRYKLIINFTQDTTIDRHYKKHAAQTVLHPQSFEELETIITHA
ncbi:MAG: Lipid A biosynthesis palmitoleoyltransferase [Chlamydiae bacterium]|nr:Lipid A biosynthesis palmitoleoyltransferase [Chlamydiota bacterium]